MAGYVDEKVAKVTLDNKGFTKNTQDTISALDKLKAAFSKINGGNASKNIAKEMNAIPEAVSNSTTKSQGLLSRLKNIFSRSTENINMSGAAKSIDQMNTDVADRTSKTSSILSRLKGIFQKADNHQGFTNSIKSIDGLNAKASGINLNPLTGAFSRAADSVKGSLNAMDVAMGIVMGNMMQKAISFGAKFFKGPIDGLNEYNEKLGSVQTIMTNTEWEIPDQSKRMRMTSKTLEDLNEYADKTIYSFKDMTKNIGTFTAAGVGLEDSAVAIKGISNLAAASGSNTQQASTAMYQLSQALASGKVGLQDWNSVVNAGMGGKLFQDRLTEMAEKMGHARDMTKSFRDSLKDGWLTSEVLINTLKEFSVDEQMLNAATQIKSFGQLVDTVQEAIGSGWATSWEYLFGGYEEAKGLWTEVGKIVNKFFDDSQGTYHDAILDMDRSLGNFRNAVLKTWKDLGGQASFFNIIKNSFEIVFKALTRFREGYRSAFGDFKTVGQSLYNVTKAIENFTEKLAKSKVLFLLATNAGRLFGNVISLIMSMFGRFISGFTKFGTGTMGFIAAINSVVSVLANFFSALRFNTNLMSGMQSLGASLANVFKTVSAVVNILVTAFVRLFGGIKTLDGVSNSLGWFKTLAGWIEKATGAIANFASALSFSLMTGKSLESQGIKITGVFKAIGTAITFVAGLLKGFVGIISKVFGSLKNLKFENPFKNMFGDKSVDTGWGDKIAAGIKKGFDKIKSVVSSASKSLADTIRKMSFSDMLKAAFAGWAGLKIFKSIKNKMGGGGPFGEIMDMFKDFVNNGKEMVSKVSEVLDGVKESLQSFTGAVKAGSLLMIASALMILALSLKMLAGMSTEDLVRSGSAIASLSYILTAAMKRLSKIDKIPPGTAVSMIGFAIGIRILAGAMKKLADLDTNQLDVAVRGIAAATLILVGAMKLLEGGKKVQTGVLSMLGFVLAIRLLVGAMDKLKDYNMDQIKTSLIGVVSLMGALALSMKVMNGVKIKISNMFGMITFAGTIYLLVMTLEKLTKLNPDRSAKAMEQITVLILELVSVMHLLRGVKIKLTTLAGLITFTTMVFVLVKCVEKLANVQPDRLIPAVEAMASIFGLLVLSMHALRGAKVNLSALLSLISFTLSVKVLVNALTEIADMNPSRLESSLQALASVMGLLVLATHSLRGAKVNLSALFTLLTFAKTVKDVVAALQDIANINPERLPGALTALGLIFLQLSAVTVAITNLSGPVSSSIGAAILLLALVPVLSQIGNTLLTLSMIPWKSLTTAMTALIATLGALTVVAAVMSSLGGGGVVGAGSLLIMSVALIALSVPLKILSTIPMSKIATALIALAVSLGIVLAAAAVAQVVGAGLLMLSGALIALGIAAVGIGAGLALAGVGIGLIITALKELAATGPAILKGLVEALDALLKSLAERAPSMLTSLIKIIRTAIKGLIVLIPDMVQFGIKLVIGLLQGFTESIPQLVSSAVKLIVEIGKALIDNIGTLVDVGIQIAVKFIQSFADGLMKYRDQIIKAVTDLLKIVSDIVLTVIGELVGPILNKLVEVLTPVKDFILGALSELATAIEPIFTPLMDALKVLFESIASIVRSVADAIIAVVQSIAQVIQALAPVFVQFFQTIQALASDFVIIIQTVAQTINTIVYGIVSVFQEVGLTIRSVFQSIADIVNSVMQGIVGAINAFAEVIRAVGEALKNVFVGIGQGIQAALQGVASVVESIGGAIKAAFEGIGSAARGLGEGIQSALQGVASIVESVGSAVKSTLEGLGKAFEGAGKFAEGFGKGIESVMNGVSKIVTSVGDAIKGIIEAIGHAFKDIGTGIERMGKGMGPIASNGFQAAAAIGAISAALLGLSGACAGGIVPNFTNDLDRLDTVMYKMNGRGDVGKLILGLGNALKTTASSAPKAADALEKFASSSEKIKSSASGMSSNIKSVANALSSVGQSTMGAVPGITVLAAGLEKVANTLSQFISRITAVGASMSSLGMMFSTTGSAVANLSTAFSSISNGTTAFGNAMTQARTALAQFGASAAGSTTSFAVLGTAMTMAMTLVVNAVNNGMNQARAALQQGFALMGASAATSMTTVVMAVNMGMMSVVNAIRTNMASVSTVISTGMSQAAAGMARGFAMMGTSAATSMALVRTTVMTGMMGVVQSIQNSMNQAATAMAASMSRIAQAISSSMSQINAQMNMSLNMMRASMQMAFMTMQMTIMTAMMQMANQIRSSSAMMHATMLQLGTQMVSAMRMAMALLNVTILTGMMQAANGVRSAAGVAHAGGVYVGSMISQGVAAGIRAHLGSVIAATNEIVAQAERAARAKAKIKSPSRLFAANVGKYIPQGVAMGIAKEMPKSIAKMSKTFGDAFSEVGGNAIDHANSMATAVSEAVNGVGQLLDDSLADMDYKPTITPVVDTTNLDKLQNGNILRGIGVDATNVPRPAYSGVPSSLQSTNTNVYDNSNKEYSITVKVDNGGKPVDGKQLAREIQQHIKDFDDQARRGKGEEVLW
ncbi:MAG: tape measure protein [[Eubacterium] sulci]|nr:tape measure protein [[Eubacterium] sulci]